VKKAYLSMALVSLLLGIMFSIQYRSSITAGNILSRDQWAEMTIEMERLHNQHDALLNELTSLRNKIAVNGAEAQNAALHELLDKADIASGLTPVSGSGIVVILNDKVRESPEDLGYTIQYWNLMMIINELKSGGAEAISLNGERLVATSGIGESGGRLTVNGQMVQAPYRISVIGPPETLTGALRLKGGEVEALQAIGAEITIQPANDLHLPAYRESKHFIYAKPLKK